MKIIITRRRISRLSMRIVKNGDVHVSAPFGLPAADIERFISKQQSWIEKARLSTIDRERRRACFYAQLPLNTPQERSDAVGRLDALLLPMVKHHAQLMGVMPSRITYKTTISRWGMCNVKTGELCFSVYLLLLPEWCMEHVVVHELCHLLEPSHNNRFYALMERYFPRWREARKATTALTRGSTTNGH
ncbi:MAG: M48 family metallopeptidase [Prevotella sp.]|nr:M48 family metallopeptidase [Prevotella sp.]